MAQMNIRVDDDVKVRTEALYAELGLTPSAVVNALFRQSLREGGIPFVITTNMAKANVSPMTSYRLNGASALKALEKAQASMADIADEESFSDEDIMNLVAEVRYGSSQ